jgi:hypothetical protein
MGIITKGMGIVMKSKMKKAGVTKPTFPGPRATELLDKEFKKRTKYQKPGPDLVESSARVRKNQKTYSPSFIEVDARIRRKSIDEGSKKMKFFPVKGKK